MKFWLLSTKENPQPGGTKTSAAPENLFKVDEDGVKLDEDKSTVFHNLVNLVAKTLFATKRARPDTCTAIAFLTTRVRDRTSTIGGNKHA
jgi:hypothetical protein